MGLTAKINSVTMGHLANVAGAYVMNIEYTPMIERRSIHVPGCEGNLVQNFGSGGNKVVVTIRVCSNTSTGWYDTYDAMLNVWAVGPFEIEGHNGRKFKRCYLQSEGIYISEPPVGRGDASHSDAVAGMVRAVFVDHGV
jgi:hypothetical protein